MIAASIFTSNQWLVCSLHCGSTHNLTRYCGIPHRTFITLEHCRANDKSNALIAPALTTIHKHVVPELSCWNFIQRTYKREIGHFPSYTTKHSGNSPSCFFLWKSCLLTYKPICFLPSRITHNYEGSSLSFNQRMLLPSNTCFFGASICITTVSWCQ